MPRGTLTRAVARVYDGQPDLVDIVSAALDPRRMA
jgi:hypothetical protein